MLADFVVVSGYSGAGKSSAMNVFEDAGLLLRGQPAARR